MNCLAVTAGPLLWAVPIAFALMGFALLVAFGRLVRGPSIFDRVVALDLSITVVVGAIGTFAIESDQPLTVRAALVVALVGFLGTLALARYLEARKRSAPRAPGVPEGGDP